MEGLKQRDQASAERVTANLINGLVGKEVMSLITLLNFKICLILDDGLTAREVSGGQWLLLFNISTCMAVHADI